MTKTTLLSILLASATATQIASADTLAQWTFESSGLGSTTPSFSPGAGVASTNFFAEAGLQSGSATAFGMHVGASAYTSPAGSGSSKSLSSTVWAIGDYYQFTLSTLGYSDLTVSFAQSSSNTGPGRFGFFYSTDGTSFTQFGTEHTVINGFTSFNLDLTAIIALNDSSSVYFRLQDTATTSANGGTVATTGTSRVDNFTVTAMPVAVPEPSVMAIVGGFGLLGLFMAARRRN